MKEKSALVWEVKMGGGESCESLDRERGQNAAMQTNKNMALQRLCWRGPKLAESPLTPIS